MPAFLLGFLKGAVLKKVLGGVAKWAIYNWILPEIREMVEKSESKFDDKLADAFNKGVDLYFEESGLL